MGLESARIKLRKALDELEAKQKTDAAAADDRRATRAANREKLRETRASVRRTVDKLDGINGRGEIRRAIRELLDEIEKAPELVPSVELRARLGLVLSAVMEHL